MSKETTDLLAELHGSDGVFGSPSIRSRLDGAADENDRLRYAIRFALDLLRNPYDGGEYEDGEVPAVDALRAALKEQPWPDQMTNVAPKVKCTACEWSGVVLTFWSRGPNDPPGNGYIRCVVCGGTGRVSEEKDQTCPSK